MKLWTIQPIEWYKKLCEDDIIYGDKKHIELIEMDFFNYAYNWMRKEMEVRIGRATPKGSYPIWA